MENICPFQYYLNKHVINVEYKHMHSVQKNTVLKIG